MATDKKPTMLRLEDSTREKIRYLAYINRRSMNAEIEFAVMQYVRSWEAANGPIPAPPKSTALE